MAARHCKLLLNCLILKTGDAVGLAACPNARPTEETLKHYYSSGVTELRTTGSDKTHEDVKGQWDLG